ncbi:MAG: hypothetical protein Q8S13_13495, partial [Dehalococcoidia bacterium]|nr:hypothetical protein [Dehalococcoidia bacterium]
MIRRNVLAGPIGLLAAVLAGSAIWFATDEASGGPVPLYGDSDCSGLVSSVDAALDLQLDAGFIDDLPCLKAADVNGDGDVNSLDSAITLQFIAGFIDELGPTQ